MLKLLKMTLRNRSKIKILKLKMSSPKLMPARRRLKPRLMPPRKISREISKLSKVKLKPRLKLQIPSLIRKSAS